MLLKATVDGEEKDFEVEASDVPSVAFELHKQCVPYKTIEFELQHGSNIIKLQMDGFDDDSGYRLRVV